MKRMEHTCSHVGVSPITDVKFKKTQVIYVYKDGHQEEGDYFEARCGVALLGHCNMNQEQFDRCHGDPFHWEYYDNYCSGKGPTKEDALESLEADMADMSNSLWF